MAASYPTSAKSFTALNAGDTIQDTDVEAAYDEITAVETGLISGLAHDLKFTDATYDIGKSGATRPRDGFFSRNVTVGGTLAVTGAVTLSGVQTAAAQPRCLAYNNATQSITNNTETVATLNAEAYDVGTMHDTVTNNSRITIPTGGDGLYLIRGVAIFAVAAGGQRYAFLQKNGTTKIGALSIRLPDGSFSQSVEAMSVEPLVATDYLELVVYQNSGGSINVGSATQSLATQLCVAKLW